MQVVASPVYPREQELPSGRPVGHESKEHTPTTMDTWGFILAYLASECLEHQGP